MLFLCFIGVRLETLSFTAVFQSPFTIFCVGMLFFAFVFFDMVAYTFHLGPVSCVFDFCLRLFLLSAGAFAFVLLSVVVVVFARSLPFAFVDYADRTSKKKLEKAEIGRYIHTHTDTHTLSTFYK